MELYRRPASARQAAASALLGGVVRQRDARDYDTFLREKVETARASMRAGRGRPDDEVEAEFATRRAAAASDA
jgi:hypothetical protein